MTIQFRLPDMLKTIRSWHCFTHIAAAAEESQTSDARFARNRFRCLGTTTAGDSRHILVFARLIWR
jgi:hypothetical protein